MVGGRTLGCVSSLRARDGDVLVFVEYVMKMLVTKDGPVTLGGLLLKVCVKELPRASQ